MVCKKVLRGGFPLPRRIRSSQFTSVVSAKEVGKQKRVSISRKWPKSKLEIWDEI